MTYHAIIDSGQAAMCGGDYDHEPTAEEVLDDLAEQAGAALDGATVTIGQSTMDQGGYLCDCGQRVSRDES